VLSQQVSVLRRRVGRLVVALRGGVVVVTCVLLLPSLVASAGEVRVASGQFSCGPGSSSNGDDCVLTVIDATHFRIDQPFVADAFYEYQGVSFLPGDQITLDAGGCVQTGGSGDTWKRYVNPSGDNSGYPDGLYFGLVTIKGAFFADNPNVPVTNAPISQVVGKALLIPKLTGPDTPTSPLDLVLGYKDDDYTDNSYSDHDNGNNDQCDYGSDGGPAWVTVAVKHGIAGPNLPAVTPKPFDLVPQGFDSNFAFENPVWGWQRNNLPINPGGVFGICEMGGIANCTSQFTDSDTPGYKFFGTFGTLCGGNPGLGHLNWFDVTYTGKITWDEWSGTLAGDDDYNMRLHTATFKEKGQPGWPAGVTFEDNNDIKLEFDSDETIDNFDQSGWWQQFHTFVDNGELSNIATKVNNHDAVVIGLMGLDVEHTYGQEIHPVHVLAIRESLGNPQDDAWAIFVRNWGDEGECSSLQHYLDLTTITVDLPRPPGVTASAVPTLEAANSHFYEHAANGLKVHPVPGGAQVTFKLSAPAGQPWEVGELHLHWPTGSAPDRKVEPASTNRPAVKQDASLHSAAPQTRAHAHSNEPGSAEALEQAIWNHMTPAQKQIDAKLHQILLPPAPILQVVAVTPQVTADSPSFPRTPPTVSTGPDPRERAEFDARMHALCASTRGDPPTQPRLCAQRRYAPVTTVSFRSAGRGPRNSLRAPVAVTLAAFAANSSGIRLIQYRIGSRRWQRYSHPFVLGAGTQTIFYSSTDGGGRSDTTRQTTLHIVAG
jgi:hypothetical protein